MWATRASSSFAARSIRWASSRATRSVVSDAPESITVLDTSRRGAAAANPSALSTPHARGHSTRSIPISSAIDAACSGPAPPNPISANPRGSIPLSTVITASARFISVSATLTIPSAHAIGSRPTSRASVPTARSAASRSRLTPPASGTSPSSLPSTRFASVTVARSPPSP